MDSTAMNSSTQNQKDNYRGSANSTKPKLGDIARTVKPIDVVERLFPQYKTVKEGSGSYKVKIGQGQHLWITDQLICLLEQPKDPSFSGRGSIDAYCICAGIDKKDQDRAREAIRAILTEFHPSLVDARAGREEIAQRLSQIKIPEKPVEEKKSAKSVPLPPRSVATKDVEALRDYLVDERALDPELIDSAMQVGAIYPAHHDLAIDYKKRIAAPGGKATETISLEAGARAGFRLNAIFVLLDHKTDKPVAYAKRGLGGSFKLNVGPKNSAGFRIGPFDERALALIAVESPIEALARMTILRKENPEIADQICIQGMCGTCNPVEMLSEAKARGITHVIAGFNNDGPGRKYNESLVEEAKKLGLTATTEGPAGEIQMSVFQREPCINAAAAVLDQLKADGLPVKEVPTENPNWKYFQFPNTAKTCESLEELDKKKIGFHKIVGMQNPSIVAARDELISSLEKAKAQFKFTDDKAKPWTLNVGNSPAVSDLVVRWHNTQKKTSAVSVNPKVLSAEFVELVPVEYVNKDWDEVCKGSPGRIFAQDFEQKLDLRAFVSPRLTAKTPCLPAEQSEKPADPIRVEEPEMGV